MRRAPVIEVTDDERAALTKWSRGRITPARLVTRAKIILLAADGRLSKDISAELGVPQKTVSKWRNRFAADRLAGIEQDAPRGGRVPAVRRVQPGWAAMSLFSLPSAAARMIFARSTSRTSVLRPRAHFISVARSSSVNAMVFATRMALILRLWSLRRQHSK